MPSVTELIDTVRVRVSSSSGIASGGAAMRRGTNLHALICRHIEGKPLRTPRIPEWTQYLAFRRDYADPFPAEYAEATVRWGQFSGIMDAAIRSRAGGIVIIEWKRTCSDLELRDAPKCRAPLTNLACTPLNIYGLQLSMLSLIAQWGHGLTVQNTKVVVFHPNRESYEVHQPPDLRAEAYDLMRRWSATHAVPRSIVVRKPAFGRKKAKR
jgi:hypothetical protein